MFLIFAIAVLSRRWSFYITSRNICTSTLVITVALIFDYQWLKCNLLLLCSNVELNPGPKQNTTQEFSIFHRNLNSIAAHNFSKLVLLKAHNSIRKFDIICFSGTYLESNILADDSNLGIPGYNLVRLIIRQIKNVEVFIYTTRVICL